MKLAQLIMRVVDQRQPVTFRVLAAEVLDTLATKGKRLTKQEVHKEVMRIVGRRAIVRVRIDGVEHLRTGRQFAGLYGMTKRDRVAALLDEANLALERAGWTCVEVAESSISESLYATFEKDGKAQTLRVSCHKSFRSSKTSRNFSCQLVLSNTGLCMFKHFLTAYGLHPYLAPELAKRAAPTLEPRLEGGQHGNDSETTHERAESGPRGH